MKKKETREAIRLILVMLAGAMVLAGCVGKTDYPTDVPQGGEAGRPTDTTYVVVHPVWSGTGGREFSRPQGVTFGYDRSIYICDTDNDRIVRLNTIGDFIEEYAVEHPVQVTQDRQLNLLCVNGEDIVYRRSHFSGGVFDTVARRDSVRTFEEIQYPGVDSIWNDVDSVWIMVSITIYDTVMISHPSGFVGIAASPLIDRYYYLTDSTRNIVSVLDVTDHGLANDIFTAFGRRRANHPIGIMTYPTGENSYDIVFTQWGAGVDDALRVVRSDQFKDVRLDTTDIYWMPAAGPKYVCRDDEGNFLVVSSLAHRVQKFTRHGNFRLEFGERGSEPGQLENPRGIAYGEKMVYIADTGNNRIVRYRLSTDLQF